MPSPLISVIIPMHNSSSTIGCLIESLKNQTLNNFEAVLVDDGSRDATLRTAQSLTEDDSRFLIIEKASSGVSETRNLGVAESHGRWIAFADSDDWLAPYALERLCKGAEQGADFCIADFYRVKDGRYSVKGVGVNALLSFDEFMRQMSLAPANYYYGSLWNKLFCRSIIDEHGLRFKTSLDFGEDHVFVLEYLQYAESIAVIGKPIYYYIDTPGSLVHRAMNPIGVAKNKNEVMNVYEKLCTKAGINNTLAGEATVMSFLITPATDGMVSPFDEKLGIAQVPPQAAENDARFKGLFHRSSKR
ncbi:MAG: glycosyltransferase family 2 protein [Coriobacteriales bacterium]